jgi:Transposase, Mutator family
MGSGWWGRWPRSNGLPGGDLSPEALQVSRATLLDGWMSRRSLPPTGAPRQPLLKAAPLSKSAASRVIATLRNGLDAWRTRSLADLDVIYVYLDGFALRVRSGGKVGTVPVLGVVAVLADGSKQLLALEPCGGESFAAWKGCLDDLVARGLRAPVLAIIDGKAGLRRAVGENLAASSRATLLRPQAPQSRAEGAQTCPR